MARSFNGSTDQINTTAGIANGPSTTTAGWVYATSLPNAYQIAFSPANVAAGAYILIYVKSTGAPAVYCQCQASGAILDPWPSGTVSIGAWTHLAVSSVFNGNTIGYVNGVQQFSTAASAPGGIGTSFVMIAGYDPGTGGRQWNGRVADTAVWNVQLTAAEVAALAKGFRPSRIRPKSLISWLPLDGFVSPEPDLSGNAINGTLTGTSFAPGPPLAMFTPRWPQFTAATSAPPPPPFMTAGAPLVFT